MGRLQNFVISTISKATRSCKADKKKLLLSVVSLLLAFAILITASYCWYAIMQSEVNTNLISLNTGKGLRINDIGQTLQDIRDNARLIPASSVDGRNIFFPADSKNFSNDTQRITYRSSNVGDKNFNYVQIDFTLTADADYTSIYLDPTTSLAVVNDSNVVQTSATRALRAALWYQDIDENNKPIVFTPQNKAETAQAVAEIDRSSGEYIKRSAQVAVPFKNYIYGKRQIAFLNKGESIDISFIIWLEGDDDDCTTSALAGNKIKLNLQFTTSWDNMEKIILVDQTNGALTNGAINKGWLFTTLNDGHHTLKLNYKDTAHNVDDMEFTMYRDLDENGNVIDGQWYCKLPGNAYNDITFKVYNDSKQLEYLFESDNSLTSTKNRGEATVYIATGRSGTYSSSTCAGYGHWYDGEIEEGGQGTDIGELDDDDW